LENPKKSGRFISSNYHLASRQSNDYIFILVGGACILTRGHTFFCRSADWSELNK
jgi:hypothetical protein